MGDDVAPDSDNLDDAGKLNDASGVVRVLAGKAERAGNEEFARECCTIGAWLQATAEGMLNAEVENVWQRVGPALLGGLCDDAPASDA